MKNVSRFVFLNFAMLVLAFFAAGISASAVSVTQDGLDVAIVTEKQSYEGKDGISARLSVMNTNLFDVGNLRLEIIPPQGYQLRESFDSTMQADVLISGKSAELNTFFVFARRLTKITETLSY